MQATFKKLYNLQRTFLPNGSQFDHLFEDGEVFKIGEVDATALLVPGHTSADMAYLVDGAVFVGDTLFMPDVGSARADFPGGDAHILYRGSVALSIFDSKQPLISLVIFWAKLLNATEPN